MNRTISSYDIVWRTPSADETGSMPIGNGDIGANVWVEPDGALRFYLSKTDAWSEVHRLLKLGRLRLDISPGSPSGGGRFEQHLDLADGVIRLRLGGAVVRFWVDAHHPAVHVEIESDAPVTPALASEPWRLGRKTIAGAIADSAYGQHDGPNGNVNPVAPVESADREWRPTRTTPVLGAWHRNEHSIYAANLRLQGLAGLIETEPDPLLSRTFGWLASGAGFHPAGSRALRGREPRCRWHIVIVALTAQTTTEAEWLDAAFCLLREVETLDTDVCYTAHRAWWQAFWERSCVHVDTPGSQDGFALSQAWHLYRFLCASMGRGADPIKFNGGIFNVALPGVLSNGADCDADYRQWGGAYWHQNTRQLYWPLLASGDLDLMEPFFDLYRRNLAAAEFRTRRWFSHDGAFFPETMYIWGTYVDENYGYVRTGKPLDHVDNCYIRRHWQGALETVAMALDRYAYRPDEAFLRTCLVPLARAAITFYDEHYPRVNGRLRLEPAQALESLWDVVNPTPDIAALEHVLNSLLALPTLALGEELASRCRRLQSELPVLPLQRPGDETILAPADEVRADVTNSEKVALWAVFPYRRHCLLAGDLDIGRATFRHRPQPSHYTCWSNDNVFAAYLGLAQEAQSHLAERVQYNQGVRMPSGHIHNFRFPSMAGAGEHGMADWIPDLDNLGVVQQTLQTMLVQADGNHVLRFPAWPRDWNVRFRLHVPGAVVEGAWEGGRQTRWEKHDYGLPSHG
jgi:hypothetical protein